MKRLALSTALFVGLTACGSQAVADAPLQARAVPEATHAPTPRPTVRPTATPTATPTARPTARPEPAPVFGEEPSGPTQLGTVVEVTDGDTIKVDVDGVVYDVRYIGISDARDPR
jgi:endonuclease YncB( thermonuclease family)